MKRMRSLLFLAGLMVLATRASQAQSGYTIQSLVKAGDTIAGVQLAPFNEPDFQITGLNDDGEMVFYALNTAGQRVLFDYNGGKFTRIATEGDTIGGVVLAHFRGGGDGPTFNGQTTFLGSDASDNHLLFQYAGGKTTLIAAPGKDAPGGAFAKSGFQIATPISMNWEGNVLFAANASAEGVYFWDAQKQQVTPIAVKGMTLNGVKLQFSSYGDPPAINNNNEMVVNVYGQGAAGKSFSGLLFIGADGKVQTIAQGGQALPGGSIASGPSHPVLNDAGVVVFVSGRGTPEEACYLWDKVTGDTLGPLVTVGQDAGGGAKVALVEEFMLDPLTASGLYQVRLNDPLGPVEVHQFFAFEDQASLQGASAASPRVQALNCPPAVMWTVNKTFAFREGPHGTLVPVDVTILDVTVKRDDGTLKAKFTVIIQTGSDWTYFYVPAQDKCLLITNIRASAQNVAAALVKGKVEQDAARCALEFVLGQPIQAGVPPGGPLATPPSEMPAPPGLELKPSCRAPSPATQACTRQVARARAHPRSGSPSRARKRMARFCSGAAGPFFSLAAPTVYLGKAADGGEAAYWIGGDRQFKLLLEDGMTTSVGTIRQVWVYPLELGNGAWNDYYQVALRANVADAGGGIHDAILLLTPTSVP